MTDPRRYRIVINGKSAGDPALREAVGAMRDALLDHLPRLLWIGARQIAHFFAVDLGCERLSSLGQCSSIPEYERCITLASDP